MGRLFEGLYGVDDMLGGSAKFIGNVATKSNKTSGHMLSAFGLALDLRRRVLFGLA